MSVDQTALQSMAARMRRRAEEEAASRARRHRQAQVMGLGYRPEGSSGGGSTARTRSMAPGASLAPAETFRPGASDTNVVASFQLDDPPRGKRARVGANAIPTRRALSGASESDAAKLAAGYQPAVLKVISYGHGASRATAIGQYIQKDEAALETHDGKLLATQDAVAAEMKEWARDFDKRRVSDDVAMFRLSVAGEGDEARLKSAVEAAFAGHRYAHSIDRGRDGTAEARVVSTLAGHSYVRGENGDEKVKHRFHLSDARSAGERQFSAPTRAMIAARVAEAIGVAAEAVGVKPMGEASHGKAGVVFQLSRLAHRGPATGADGAVIATEQQIRKTAQDWDRSLNSFTPRDVMHMILSSKAGTNKEALVRAARGFLHEQFADHKFAFALHDDKEADGHMHVHAIVAVKGEGGQRLRPGPSDLGVWRSVYAGHAQAQGMKIVATSAAYRASSQSYGPRDKAIVDVAANPRPGREAMDRAYARANPHVVERARQRIQRAQANPIRIPASARQLEATAGGLKDWQAVVAIQPGNRLAVHYVERMTQAIASGSVLVALNEYRKGAAMAEATAAEMRENLKEINDSVATAAGALEGQSKAEFLRRSAETMEMLAIRTDLKAKQESGATQLSEDEARQIAGPHAEALIARAREIQATEEREALRAEEIRDRAVERELRDERTSSTDPDALQRVADDRAMVRNAETIAARERQEAQAAAEAARTLAHDPSQRLNPSLVQGDRLEELKHQQDHGINTSPVEGEEAESHKPKGQRQ